MDCSPPGSSAHGIFQARVREWGAIAFSVSKNYTLVTFVNLPSKTFDQLNAVIYNKNNTSWHTEFHPDIQLALNWPINQ